MTVPSKAQIAAITAPHKVSLRLAKIRATADERDRLMARLARDRAVGVRAADGEIDEPAAERSALRLEEMNDG